MASLNAFPSIWFLSYSAAEGSSAYSRVIRRLQLTRFRVGARDDEGRARDDEHVMPRPTRHLRKIPGTAREGVSGSIRGRSLHLSKPEPYGGNGCVCPLLHTSSDTLEARSVSISSFLPSKDTLEVRGVSISMKTPSKDTLEARRGCLFELCLYIHSLMQNPDYLNIAVLNKSIKHKMFTAYTSIKARVYFGIFSVQIARTLSDEGKSFDQCQIILISLLLAPSIEGVVPD